MEKQTLIEAIKAVAIERPKEYVETGKRILIENRSGIMRPVKLFGSFIVFMLVILPMPMTISLSMFMLTEVIAVGGFLFGISVLQEYLRRAENEQADYE